MKRANDKMVINFVFTALLVVFLLLFSESLAYAAGDIFCNRNKKRYDTPNQGVPECQVRLKNLMGGCFLSPQCGNLLNDKTLKVLYNQAIFLRGSVKRPESYKALVNYVINPQKCVKRAFFV